MKLIIQNTSVTNEQKLNDLLGQTEPNGECREWVRCFNTDGYPRMYGNVKVHRLVYRLATNEEIDGKVIRHTCDNPKCINPKHLLSGTPADNARDRQERGRTYRTITPEIIRRVRELLEIEILKQKEIAILMGIDPRRVSDINCKRYNLEGNFVGQKRG